MTDDEKYMRRALALARRGAGATSPNPMVGAVIVKGGKIVGEAWHKRAGEPHAEIIAIEAAGKRRRGATMYINLEPCVHTGRTGPCAPRVVESGITRLVVGTADPNPKVAGRGLKTIAKTGICVETGLMEQKCRRLNEVFFHWVKTKRPFVILKAAQSVDGKIATPSGQSKWITSAQSRHKVHQLRSRVDAILVGVGAVIEDDPMLTARSSRTARQPIPVILDANLRTPPKSKVLSHPSGCVIVAKRGASASKRKELEKAGAAVWTSPAREGLIKWEPLLEKLGELEITSLLIEGGSRVFGSALEAGIVQKVWLFVAPTIIGGAQAVGTFGHKGARTLDEAARLKNFTVKRCGPDLWIEGYL